MSNSIVATDGNSGRGGRPRGTVAPRSDRLKIVRDALDMTQEETAAQMNLSVNTIAKMEQQGREPGTKAGKIALNALQDRAIAEGKLVLKEGQLVKP